MATDLDTDLLVYGATPAGIIAAVAAARDGVRVVVVEPTAHVGGMMTSGLMAAFLVSALHLPPAAQDHFTDDDGLTFEDSINRLADAGLASGCSVTRFCPTQLVTRGQAASLLDRAYELPDATLDHFTDDGAASRPVTRGQVMAFLYRIEVGPGG